MTRERAVGRRESDDKQWMSDAAAPLESRAAASDPGAQEIPSWKQTGWWRTGRWVVLALIVVAGVAFAWIVAETDLASPWDDWPTVLGYIARLAFFTALTLGVIALVSWLVARFLLRKQDWPFRRMAWSPGVLIPVLIFLMLANGGAIDDLVASRDDTSSVVVEDTSQDPDEPVAEPTDPVGMKLAGKSDQLSESDQQAIRGWTPVSSRFGVMISRIVEDYIDDNVTAEAWIASTKKRLRQAEKARLVVKARTARIEDPAVKAQLARLDRVRARTSTAFHRLLGAVEGSGSETDAGRLADRRLRQQRAANRHILDLIRPYLDQDELDRLEQAQKEATS